MKVMTNENAVPVWRYRVGVGLFILHLILPLIAVVVVPVFGFPAGVNAVLVGLSVVGFLELLLFAAAGIMGREGLSELFGKLGPWFKNMVRWDDVDRGRYRVGLWLFVAAAAVPVAIIYLAADSIVDAQGNTSWGFYAIVAVDAVFLVSFLVLGGPFWDRVRALFRWNATISFRPQSTDVNLEE